MDIGHTAICSKGYFINLTQKSWFECHFPLLLPSLVLFLSFLCPFSPPRCIATIESLSVLFEKASHPHYYHHRSAIHTHLASVQTKANLIIPISGTARASLLESELCLHKNGISICCFSNIFFIRWSVYVSFGTC